ncbi:MAG: hypothetical protein QOJ65_1931, partial [Fimbriimonadaceae bacterium]|nr:hypothetical protein [Fimbriimonadaceae bacterium]
MQHPPDYGYARKKLKLDHVLTAVIMAIAAGIVLFPLLVRARDRAGEGTCAE